jgi:hypothetical protein
MKFLDTIKSMLKVKTGKGVGSSGAKTGVVAILVIVLLVAIAPVAFDSIFNINTTTTPTWFKTVMQVLVAIVLIFITLKYVD